MGYAKKRNTKMSGARVKDTIAEARAILKTMGYNHNAKYEELAGIAEGLASELRENPEFGDLHAFFRQAARALETNIIRRVARGVVRSNDKGNTFRNKTRDADLLKDAYAKKTLYEAKQAASKSFLSGTSEALNAERHELFLRARETLQATRVEVKEDRSAAKHERKNVRVERDIRNALSAMKLLDPSLDLEAAEIKLRQTMKPA